MKITEPIRIEHRELLPKIEELRQTADAVGAAADGELSSLIEDNIRFLRYHLVHTQRPRTRYYTRPSLRSWAHPTLPRP